MSQTTFNRYIMRAVALFTLIVMLFVTGVQTSYAGDNRDTYKKEAMAQSSFLDRSIFYVSQGVHSDNLTSKYDLSKNMVGIDSLYGTNWRSFTYKGEVPRSMENSYENYPMSLDNKLGEGDYRRFSDWDKKEFDKLGLEWKDDGTQDLHAYPLVNKGNEITSSILNMVSGIGFTIISGVNAISGFIVKLLISFSNLDFSDVLGADFVKNTSTSISKVLLLDGSSMSPLLAIALVLWVFGILAIIFRFVTKGGDTMMRATKEIGILFLSFIIAMGAVSGAFLGLETSLVKATNDLAGDIASPDDNNSSQLFDYESEDGNLDTVMTLNAMSSKPYIDAIIKSEFGRSVNELDVIGGSADGKTWGNNVNLEEAAKKLLTNNTMESLDIYRGKDKDKTSNYINLGYYFYCACSNTDVRTGSYDTVNQDRLLMIPDFLAEVDQMANGSEKAKDLMKHIMEPTPDVGSMLGVTFVSVGTVFAIGLASVYAMFGRFIFTIGIIFIPILPILLLIPNGNFRQMCLQAVKTWGVSLLKMLIGLAFITIVLTISSIICSYATNAPVLYIIDFMLLVALGIFGPKLFSEVNRSVGRGQLEFANQFDRKFDNLAARRMNDKYEKWKHPITARANKRAAMSKKISDAVMNGPSSLAAGDFRDNSNGTDKSANLTNLAGGFGSSDMSKEQLDKLEELKDNTNKKLNDIASKSDADIAEESGNKEYADILREKKELTDKLENSKLRRNIMKSREKRKDRLANSNLYNAATKVPIARNMILAAETITNSTQEAALSLQDNFTKTGFKKQMVDKKVERLEEKANNTLRFKDGTFMSNKEAVVHARSKKEEKVIKEAEQKARRIIFSKEKRKSSKEDLSSPYLKPNDNVNNNKPKNNTSFSKPSKNNVDLKKESHSTMKSEKKQQMKNDFKINKKPNNSKED